MSNFAKTKFQVSAISIYGNKHTIHGRFFKQIFFLKEHKFKGNKLL